MKEFFINNWDTVIILIWWIITFWWWIVQFFKSQRQQVKIEKLKTELELEKHQKILNSEKFRKWYEEFIDLIVDQIAQRNESNNIDIDQKMMNFIKVSLLFAWPDTIKSFGAYRKEAKIEDSNDILLYMENLIGKMRQDLWVSNEWLSSYDILQMFFVWDLKESLYNSVIEENRDEIKEDLRDEIAWELHEESMTAQAEDNRREEKLYDK